MGCCDDRKGEGNIREVVRDRYAKIAVDKGSCCGPPSPCCGNAPTAEALAKNIGYADEDLASLPEGANLGLSCGNPTALASLKQGEIVVDLGSGGGLDVFIAAGKVGPEGRAIGVDMTPEMLDTARRNATRFGERTGLDNVEFRLGEIEHLPIADGSVDVLLSNCVINLSPEKAQVWREAARVLKPGGRVAVTDMALLRPLPEAVLNSVEARVGCVAGAVLVEETKRLLENAGFVDIDLTPQAEKIDAMDDYSDSFYRSIMEHLPEGRKMSDYLTSLAIAARKPA
ncbi:MAG: arsenite methyltransferase [Planctomycetota bacterium]|jgi:ubiquinone/menaquinone biosynthesis C-methylase UbiE